MSETKLIANIDSELKTELKVIAAKQHKTMSEIIAELVKEYIENNK